MKINIILYGILMILLTNVSAQSVQNALAFDGANDFIQTTADGILSNGDRTFEAWVFNKNTSTACILDYGTNVPGGRNTFLIGGDGSLGFIGGGSTANLVGQAGDVPLDQWVHVAYVLSSGFATLYVNGIAVDSGSMPGVSTPSNGTQIRVGQRVAGGSIPFDGKIDEVRVWGIARTNAEILANMNSELCNLDANLELYLTLNQGIANGSNSGLNNAFDYSIYNNGGTLNNFLLSGTQSNWSNGVVLSSGFSNSIDVQVACGAFTWINGITYGSSNNSASFTVTNPSGCDSIVNLDLTIFSTINTMVNQNDEILTANQIAINYQWITCPDYTPIIGETNQTFTASENGQYAVILSYDNMICADTSACIVVNSINYCQNSLLVQNAIPSDTYEAINDVQANGTINVGANVIMNAGNFIELLPDFDCNAFADLHIFIQPCQ